MKRIFSLVLLLGFLAALFSPLSAFATVIHDHGIFQYSVHNGSVTIEGCSKSASGQITVPATIGGKPVSVIGSSAFSNCTAITSVTLPETVTDIRAYAFSGCKSLASINAPSSLKSIGDLAFYQCESLLSFELHSGLKSVGESAFEGCKKLSEVLSSNFSGTIGERAFYGCVALTSITLSGGVQSIGQYAFFGCTNLAFVEAGDDLYDVGLSAFSSTAWMSAQPEGTVYVGNVACGIKSSSKTETIVLKDATVGIAEGAFSNLETLVSVSFPESLKYIGKNAFRGCVSLKEADFNEGLTTIGEHAFYRCENLESVTFPTTLIEIGENAFQNCQTLQSVEIPDGVRTVGRYAFENCYNLLSLRLPGTLRTVEDNLFSSCIALKEVVIPEGVVNIDNSAFSDCTSLASVTLPASLKKIGPYAFEDCTALNTVRVSDLASFCEVECEGLTASPLHRATNLYFNDTLVTELVVPSTTERIGGYLFHGFKSLTAVSIPSGVKEIGNMAFADCTALATVSGANGVTQMGFGIVENTAWYHAQPNGMIYIGKVAYGYKGKLPAEGNLTIKSGTKGIAARAFYECKEILSLTVPSSVLSIGANAFEHTTNDLIVYCVPGGAVDRYARANGVSSSDINGVKILSHPKDVFGTYGKTLKVTVKAEGKGLTYEWYYKDADMPKFQKTTKFKGNTYSLEINVARSGRKVYCIVKDQDGNTLKTRTVETRLKATIRKQPQSVQAAKNKKTVVSVDAVGEGLVYKWYYKDKGSSKFKLSTNVRGASYNVVMTPERSGRQLYCVVTDEYGNRAASKIVTISMKAHVLTQPKSVTVAKGKTAKVTVEAGGEGLTYRWYYKDRGMSKYKLTTAFKSSSYAVSMTAARSGRKIYCVVTDKFHNSVQSATVTIKMK